VEYLRESGFFSDLLCCNPHRVNREELQIALKIRRVVKGEVHRDDWAPRELIEKSAYRAIARELKHEDGSFRFSDFAHATPLHRTQGPIEFHVVTFKKPLTPRKATERMRSWQLRPADLIEFLSFGTSVESLFERCGNSSYRQTYVALDSWLPQKEKNQEWGRRYPMMTYHADPIADPIIELTHVMQSVRGDPSEERKFPPHVYYVGVPLYHAGVPMA